MPQILLGLFVLFLLAALGHGLWLLVAWFFRSLSGGATQPTKHNSPNDNPRRCADCGGRLSKFGDHCPVCGRNSLGSPLATLGDLKTTLQQLRALNDEGFLDFETFERTRRCVQARLDAIVPKPQPTPVEIYPEVVPVVVAPEPEPSPPPARVQPPLLQPQMAQLLEVCEDVRDVLAEKSERVVEWGRRVGESDNPIVAAFVPEPAQLVDAEPIPALAPEPTPEKLRKPRRSLAEVFGSFHAG